jgi:hypothetical protein
MHADEPRMPDFYPQCHQLSDRNSGFASATFSDATGWTDPNFSGDIIFESSGLGILGITALFQGLETYDLQSSAGPIFSAVDFLRSSSIRFRTSLRLKDLCLWLPVTKRSLL